MNLALIGLLCDLTSTCPLALVRGMYFSMMEGHLLLATLAQRISFSLVPGQSIVPDPIHHLALRPAGEVNVIVKRR